MVAILINSLFSFAGLTCIYLEIAVVQNQLLLLLLVEPGLLGTWYLCFISHIAI